MVLEYIIMVLFALLVVALTVYFCINEKQVILNWLIMAVTEAEKALGSGTGQLKLLSVYEKFVSQFKIISRFISFDLFSKLVDVALNSMDKLLKNDKIAAIITGEQKQKDTTDEKKILNE